MEKPALVRRADPETRFALWQNVPNPFTARTLFAFSIPGPAWVKLALFDLKENRVGILFQGILQAGHYQLDWDGKGADGQRLRNGCYSYMLESEGFLAVRKLTLLPGKEDGWEDFNT